MSSNPTRCPTVWHPVARRRWVHDREVEALDPFAQVAEMAWRNGFAAGHTAGSAEVSADALTVVGMLVRRLGGTVTFTDVERVTAGGTVTQFQDPDLGMTYTWTPDEAVLDAEDLG